MASSARAPLMASGDHIGHGDDEGDGNGGAVVVNEVADDDDRGGAPEAKARPTLFVWLLTLAAGISGLLFGYDTGVISATLVSINTSLSNRELTSLDKSLITSSTSLFALVFSPLSSVLADRFGRRSVILVADVLFAIGAIVQAVSNTVPAMVGGRCIVGAAVGAASFVTPLYLAEVAPAAHRGRLVTLNVLAITLGQVVAYVIGWAFAEYAAPGVGWRWMVGLGAAPAVVQAFITMYMPETPRWLVLVGRVNEAKRVVMRISGIKARGTDVHRADRVVKEIELEVTDEREARRLRGRGVRGGEGKARWGWLGAWDELLGQGKNRRALAIACLLQGLQQLCGFNSLMYFSATLLQSIGFDTPTLASLSVSGTNFVFTVFALLLIDRIGRRRILIWSIPVMIFGLLLAAYGFSIIKFPQGTSSVSMSSSSIDLPGSTDRTSASVILAAIMVYVASYAIGLGNVPWMQSELFPLSVRSLGSGVATATNWAANFVIGLTFLPLMDALSPPWTFVLYAGICVVGYALVVAIYPETAGLSLEETTALLVSGWGVRRGRAVRALS